MTAPRIQRLVMGAERATVLVVDDFAAEPQQLVRRVSSSPFVPQGAMFPGVRTRAPLSYRQMLLDFLKPLLPEFGLAPGSLSLQMAHYSLVSLPPEQLVFLQRIPHIDSVATNGLATVHYLFRGDWGGTAFYRHRQTGHEFIDSTRREAYFRCLDEQSHGPDAPAAGYINGDTALFEQIGRVDGVFNRLVVYRRNCLHSACIDNARVPPPDPVAGRLSINGFVDVG